MEIKQYKNLQSQIKDVDEKGRVLVAANAIGNIDSDKDVSVDGSFNKTLKENFGRLRWFLNHDTSILLGVPIEGKQSGVFLEMLGQLNMKKEISRDVYEDYKLYAEYGKSLEHSIGVIAMKKEMKGGIRYVSEWMLKEYSTLTAWGANEQTPMLGIKSEKEVVDLIDWLDLKIRKGNYTDEKFKLIEQQISTLKSLCIEPETTTQEAKPNKTDKSLLLTLQQFTKSLKS